MKGEGEGGRTRDSASGDVKSFPGCLGERCRRGCGVGGKWWEKKENFLFECHGPQDAWPEAARRCFDMCRKELRGSFEIIFLDAGWHVFRVWHWIWSLTSLGFQSCDAWHVGDKRNSDVEPECGDVRSKGREKHKGLAKDLAWTGIVCLPRPGLPSCHM